MDSQIDWIPQLSELATRHLAETRASGNDPAHGGDAAVKRGEKNQQRQHEIQEWEADNERPPPELFEQEIRPLLQQISAGEMAQATGLSRPYCSMIRRGAYTPHPKHWAALREVAEAT